MMVLGQLILYLGMDPRIIWPMGLPIAPQRTYQIDALHKKVEKVSTGWLIRSSRLYSPKTPMFAERTGSHGSLKRPKARDLRPALGYFSVVVYSMPANWTASGKSASCAAWSPLSVSSKNAVVKWLTRS
jgi:hypothetical protein